ncbi:MAG: hypothetical protein AAGC72_05745 [Planctomycetota bacterium]
MTPEYAELLDKTVDSPKLAEDLQSDAEPTIQERLAAETQQIVNRFQQSSGCDNLKTYKRETTIDYNESDDGVYTRELTLHERFDKTMTKPYAGITAVVSINWPVDGGSEDQHNMPTNFVATFKALAGMFDGGRSIEQAMLNARRWADSTIKVMLDARDDHACNLGIELESEGV